MQAKKPVLQAVLIPALLAITLLLAVVLGSCGSTATGVKTYTDADAGYSFEYPASWKVQKTTLTPGTLPESGAPAPGATVSEAIVYDKDSQLGGSHRDLAQVRGYWLGGVPTDEDEAASYLASEKSDIEDSIAHTTDQTVVEALAETSVSGMSGFKVTLRYSVDGGSVTRTMYWLYSEAVEYEVTVQAVDENWSVKQPVFAALLASFKPGAATQWPTTTTQRPTTTTQPPTTTTTRPPVAVVLAGYEQVAVRTVAVIINDSYPGIEGDAIHPLDEMVGAALEAMGLVAMDAGVDCDATLTIELEGTALSATYEEDEGNFIEWSGAAYTGTIEFAVPGREGQRWEVSERREPPNFIGAGSYPRDHDAPFNEIFLGPLLRTLSNVWGPERTIETIGMWPDFYGEIRGSAGDWLASVATKITPRLMEMWLSQEFGLSQLQGTRYCACQALAQIVARKAVPAEEQSVIVRTLISDLDDSLSAAHSALPAIMSAIDGETVDDAYHWDAQAWTDWADAHGY